MSVPFADSEIEKILDTYFKIPVGAEYEVNFLERLKKFEVRETDIFLIGHAKTGTTWAQEMIWLIANDLDFEGAKTFIDERFPVLELFTFDTTEWNPELESPLYHSDSITFIENQKDPRFIKTHLRGSYLPEQIQNGSRKPKIIYIARNVKDTCLSMYYFLKNLLKLYTGTLDDFCKVFMAGRVGSGTYWEHVLYFWKRRNDSNILFLKYEDMKNNLSEVIRQVTLFLDKPFTEDQLTTLIKRLDFETMKNNPAVNHDDLYKKSGFIRSGKVGAFKEDMSVDMIKKFDIWTEESLKGSDFEI